MRNFGQNLLPRALKADAGNVAMVRPDYPKISVTERLRAKSGTRFQKTSTKGCRAAALALESAHDSRGALAEIGF
jgi:hypothetical protein